MEPENNQNSYTESPQTNGFPSANSTSDTMGNVGDASPQPNFQPSHGTTNNLPGAFELFGPSFNAIVFNLKAYAFVAIVPTLVLGLLLVLATLVPPSLSDSAAPAISSLVMMVIGVAVFAALLFAVYAYASVPYLLLKGASREKVTVKQALTAARKYVWRFLGVSLLSSLIILIGLVLLIVPGFFAIQRLMLAVYFLYDKDISIIQSMKLSAAQAKQSSGALWGVVGVSGLLSLLSNIPLVGFLASLGAAAYSAAPAVRYQQLKGSAPASMPAQPADPTHPAVAS